MRSRSVILFSAAALLLVAADPPNKKQGWPLPNQRQARAILEQAYAQNRAAFLKKDLDAVLRQRAADFEALTPDGATHNSAEMAQATRNLLNNVVEWIDIGFKLGPIQVAPDTLTVDVEQHTVRKVQRDGQTRRLENWVNQRETWVHSADGLKIRRVENIRDQCVLIDGKPRDSRQEEACVKRGVLAAAKK